MAGSQYIHLLFLLGVLFLNPQHSDWVAAPHPHILSRTPFPKGSDMPRFHALDTGIVRKLQGGAPDANGQTPERLVSDGAGNPCRHCLREIPKGAPMLVLAHRPFAQMHPYAEVGPIFLCANPCTRGGGTDTLPEILTTSPDYLVKGYSADERIVYGTGAVVPTDTLRRVIDSIFDNPNVAFVHLRSARNNCYQARAERSATQYQG